VRAQNKAAGKIKEFRAQMQNPAAAAAGLGQAILDIASDLALKMRHVVPLMVDEIEEWKIMQMRRFHRREEVDARLRLLTGIAGEFTASITGVVQQTQDMAGLCVVSPRQKTIGHPPCPLY